MSLAKTNGYQQLYKQIKIYHLSKYVYNREKTQIHNLFRIYDSLDILRYRNHLQKFSS